MIRVQFDVEALDDLVQAIEYYDDESPGAGASLLASVAEALDQLVSFPASAPQVDEGLRAKRLIRFSFRILYAERPDELRVVAFAHEHRHPDFWRSRR